MATIAICSLYSKWTATHSDINTTSLMNIFPSK